MSQDKLFYNFPARSSIHYFFLCKKEDPLLPLYKFFVVTSNSPSELNSRKVGKEGKGGQSTDTGKLPTKVTTAGTEICVQLQC